jgi:hypothetical protein
VKRSEYRRGLLGALPLTSSAIAAAVVLISSAPALTAQASVSHSCLASNLGLTSIRLRATATVTYWDLAFRNVGSRSCRLRGYPKVHLLGRRAKPLHDRFSAVTTDVRNVTLRRRRVAFFTVLYVPGAHCGRDHHYAYGLAAAPPGATRSQNVMRSRFAVCDASVGGRPNISPIRPHLNGL